VSCTEVNFNHNDNTIINYACQQPACSFVYVLVFIRVLFVSPASLDYIELLRSDSKSHTRVTEFKLKDPVPVELKQSPEIKSKVPLPQTPVNSKQSALPQSRKKEVRILFLCARDEEASAALAIISERATISTTLAHDAAEFGHTKIVYSSILDDWSGTLVRIYVCCPANQGPFHSLHASHLLFRHLKPKLVFMTGVCAGDREKTALGDVLVANQAFYYETGKSSSKGHSSSPIFVKSTRRLLMCAKKEATQLLGSDRNLWTKKEAQDVLPRTNIPNVPYYLWYFLNVMMIHYRSQH